MTECTPWPRAITLAAALLAASAAHADGNGIDTIYHPYVQPLEKDVEIRLTQANAHDSLDGQTWRVGYGQALTPRLFAEAYVIGQQHGDEALRVSGYEVEAMWQLTEQGEYSADWAVLADFERPHDGDSHGASLMLIGERQWGRLVGTLNASVGYEWGNKVNDEPETRLALQARYRYTQNLEPAVELFVAENLRALGPALLGTTRLGAGRRLNWEAGLAVGLDHASPDLSVRGKLEFEF
jgi:hypothetical protein